MEKNRVFLPADILLPEGQDLKKWSVVACDQYTSEPAYWERVGKYVGQAPSTFHLILPEVWLEQEGVEGRIAGIHRKMQEYLEDGTLKEYAGQYVYLQRTLSDGKVRQGLVGMLDLESYDYTKGAQPLTRPTEGTVESRIPPRMRVRADALLESPHIMVLIDDPGRTVIEPLQDMVAGQPAAYDVDLMEQGGHLRGWLLGQGYAEGIQAALDGLFLQAQQTAEPVGKGPVVFAVGDGNHSLATAKACFEQIKKSLPQQEWERHPARYALVELVNVHDPALEFEPIHRVLFDVDGGHLFRMLKERFILDETAPQKLQMLCGGTLTEIGIQNPCAQLAVGSLQDFLDQYLAQFGGRIDYIHGEDTVYRLCEQPRTVGFLLPPMKKSDLFLTVLHDGVLPRKTFSMGHAQDKRFYFECRRIR